MRNDLRVGRAVTWVLVFAFGAAAWGQPVDRRQPVDKRQAVTVRDTADAGSKHTVVLGLSNMTRSRDGGSLTLVTTSGAKLTVERGAVQQVARGDGKHKYLATIDASEVVKSRAGDQYVLVMGKAKEAVSVKDVVEHTPPAKAVKPDPGDTARKPTPADTKVTAAKRAELLKHPKMKTPVRELIKPVRAATPSLTTKLRTAPKVTAGGDPVAIPLSGSDLGALTSAAAYRNNKPDPSVKVSLTNLDLRKRRTAVVTAAAETEPGKLELRFMAGRRVVGSGLPLQVVAAPTDDGLPLMIAIEADFKIPPRATRTDVTHYRSSEPGSRSRALDVVGLVQNFVAEGTHITKVDFQARGSGTAAVVITGPGSGGNLELARQSITLNSTTSRSVTFDEPVAVTPGNLYRLWLVKGGSSTFEAVVSAGAGDYPWSSAWGKPSADESYENRSADWNATVHGYWLGKPAAPARPTKHALIICLENGGLSLENIEEISENVPEIAVATCGSNQTTLRGDETLAEALMAMAGLGLHCLNPTNWTVEWLTFEDWWAPVTDHVMETINDSLSGMVAGTTPLKYDKIVQLDDGEFTRERVLQEIEDLSDEYVIDMHFLCHGGTNVIVGDNHEWFTPSNFFRPLYQRMVSGAAPLHLRAVYQMNCSSGTLVDDWRAVGAEVVNGTEGDKLNCMPTMYHHFLQGWLAGKSFKKSVDDSYAAAVPYWSVVWVMDADKVPDSKHSVHGDGDLVMSSP